MKYMFETVLMMMAFLYGGLLSEKFLWLFPIALASFSIRCYLEDEAKKKNRKK